MKRRWNFWLGVLAAILTVALVHDAWSWLSTRRANESIRAPQLVHLQTEVPAEAMFAQAYALAARQQDLRALTLYREVAGSAVNGARLRVAALYNIGNLHLRRAMAARAEGAGNQAMTLFELAKQSYRDALALDPGFWDAKYNLERTLRLAPDPEALERPEPPKPTPRRSPFIVGDVPLGPP